MKRAIYKYLIGLLLAVSVIFSSGCTSGEQSRQETSGSTANGAENQESVPREEVAVPTDASNQTVTSVKPLLVLSVDTESQQMVLEDMDNYRQFVYSYDSYTNFFDNYGEFTSVTSFAPGRAAEVFGVSSAGILTEIRLSGIAWEKSGVERYSLDRDKGILTIESENYKFSEERTRVFSGSTVALPSDIGKNDVLRVVGRDRDVWAITITTGHGVLSIINTKEFDNSLICIGNLYTIIRGDMHMEVPEGSYKVTVANNGYGGTAEVFVPKNQTVVLDLNTLKGEGPKSCLITFILDVPGAILRLDGNVIQPDQEISVNYGRHRLSVAAEGYENWNKYLYVNSPTAKIVLEMTQDGSNKTESSGTDTSEPEEDSENSGSSDKSDKPSEGNSTTPESENTTEDDKKDAELEYITTIRDMVTSLFSS